uniref:Uncharacterized protein n=1 Tax=Cacopsylla melanoneura TaxID=428564 RepID=A0A8D9BPZ6_9HEMI
MFGQLHVASSSKVQSNSRGSFFSNRVSSGPLLNCPNKIGSSLGLDCPNKISMVLVNSKILGHNYQDKFEKCNLFINLDFGRLFFSRNLRAYLIQLRLNHLSF